MWNLKGQTAIVTGGTKGIGKATVFEFLDLGAKVLFTARNKEDVREFEDHLRSRNFDATGLVADSSLAEDREKISSWLREKWESLDILVNNAGLNIRKRAEQYSEEQYQEILAVNLVAPFELSRKLLPFLENGNKATIINISSVAASQDVGTGTPYGMSKAGLLQQTRSLAVEWASKGIRVNAVSPWFTKTPLTEGFLAQEEKLQPILSRTPLGRIARPEEIASVIAFLAMEKSSYITGQNVVVDGGMSINAI